MVPILSRKKKKLLLIMQSNFTAYYINNTSLLFKLGYWLTIGKALLHCWDFFPKTKIADLKGKFKLLHLKKIKNCLQLWSSRIFSFLIWASLYFFSDNCKNTCYPASSITMYVCITYNVCMYHNVCITMYVSSPWMGCGCNGDTFCLLRSGHEAFWYPPSPEQ